MPSSKKSFGKTISLAYAAAFLILFILGNFVLYKFLKHVLMISLQDQEARHIVSTLRFSILFLTLAGIAFVVVISSLLGNYVSHRLRKMTVVAIRHAKGNLSGGLPVDEDDELGLLADSMNHIVSSLKKRISEIENEKTKLSTLLNHMTEGVLAVDQRHQILIMNPSASKILNIQAGAATGKSLLEIIRNPTADSLMQRAIEEDKNAEAEIELSFPKKMRLKISAIGIRRGEAEICGIMVFYDISQIRQLETMRREFVANASHELRTPLTSIKGFIETLLAGAIRDPEKSVEFLKIMQEDTDRLTRLVDGLLELSLIESKQIPFHLEPVEIKDEIVKVLGTLAPHLQTKGITVENQTARASLPLALADRDKLKQVLVNLIENAIKFNRENGKIMISAYISGSFLKVAVSDTGIGISEKLIPRIFERFFRIDRSRSNQSGGTGLGLSIVKHIIEAHGGRVFCESSQIEGSTFSFTLPLLSSSSF